MRSKLALGFGLHREMKGSKRMGVSEGEVGGGAEVGAGDGGDGCDARRRGVRRRGDARRRRARGLVVEER